MMGKAYLHICNVNVSIEPDTLTNTPMSPTSLTNISDETVSTNVSATTTNNNDSGSK